MKLLFESSPANIVDAPEAIPLVHNISTEGLWYYCTPLCYFISESSFEHMGCSTKTIMSNTMPTESTSSSPSRSERTRDVPEHVSSPIISHHCHNHRIALLLVKINPTFMSSSFFKHWCLNIKQKNFYFEFYNFWKSFAYEALIIAKII